MFHYDICSPEYDNIQDLKMELKNSEILDEFKENLECIINDVPLMKDNSDCFSEIACKSYEERFNRVVSFLSDTYKVSHSEILEDINSFIEELTINDVNNL
jgi:hypothetical protein